MSGTARDLVMGIRWGIGGERGAEGCKGKGGMCIVE